MQAFVLCGRISFSFVIFILNTYVPLEGSYARARNIFRASLPLFFPKILFAIEIQIRINKKNVQ